MTCGIYSFHCGPYFYVGRSIDIERRWRRHLQELENGKHNNSWVRRAFKKYGWTDQCVLVECEPHLNRDNEQHFIDLHRDSEFCMNLSNSAVGGSGPHTEESKARLREAHARPEVKAKHRAAVKANAARPEVKAKRSASRKAVAARPGQREKHSAAVKAAHARPGQWEKRSAALKEAFARPEVKAKRCAANKAAWARRKAAKLEAELAAFFDGLLADIPEDDDTISMFEVKHEEA